VGRAGPELVNRVEGGEEVTITRDGRAAVRLDALRSRRADTELAQVDRTHELLIRARGAALRILSD